MATKKAKATVVKETTTASPDTQTVTVNKKSMSKEDAEAIVSKYAGINGNNTIEELNQAKEVLRNA